MNLKKIFSLLATSLLILTGCAVQQPITIMTPFNAEEANLVFKTGKNSIKGSALLRQNNGGVVTCAGRQVSLLAVTAYSNERIFAIYNSNDRGFRRVMFANEKIPFTNDNPEYYKSAKITTCDAQGYFKFDGIADGSYYLVTSIQWQASQYLLEGGNLMQKVIIQGGETKEVVLSQ